MVTPRFDPKPELSPVAVGCSVAALTGAAAASTATLLWDGAFPDPAGATFNAVLAEGRGWSAVTLGLAVPLGITALVAAGRGSLRARLVWAGVMVYLAYTYLEMAVAPPFTPLYLVYVATFATAIPAALIAAAGIRSEELAAAIGERAPRRGAAVFAFAFAAGLSLSWLKGIVTRTVAGDFGWPTGVDAVGHVVHALDLGLVVPLGVATGWLLATRRPAGWVAGGITLVFAVVMGSALVAMVGTSAWTQGTSLWIVTPFAGIVAVAAALGLAFFRAVDDGVGYPSARRSRG